MFINFKKYTFCVVNYKMCNFTIKNVLRYLFKKFCKNKSFYFFNEKKD